MAGGQIRYDLFLNTSNAQSSLNKFSQQLQKLGKFTQGDILNLNKGIKTEQAKKKLAELKTSVAQMDTALKGAFNKDLGTFNVDKFNQSLKKMDLKQVQKGFKNAGVQGEQAFRDITTQVMTTNVQLKQSNGFLQKIGKTFLDAAKWSVAYGAINKISQGIRDAYGYVKELDSSLNDIRIVTGMSKDEMADFAEEANKAAKSLGKTTTEYTKASLIYFQQGLEAPDVEARANVTLKAANVTGQSTEEVSEQLTAVWNGYKVSSSEAELYIDKLAAVAATTASDLEELSTGMSKVASAANLMGVDVDQLNGMLSTVISVTKQAPESVGTAFKTIFARMSDIEAGLDTETTLSNYTEQMQAIAGINVLDANGQIRDMGDVIEEVGGKWDQLSREQQLALAQAMAGTRQYNNLLSLFDNWDMYDTAAQKSADAAGTLQEQQDIYMDSIEAHLNQLKASTEDLYDSLMNPEGIKPVIDAATKLVDLFGNMIDSIGGMKGVLMLLPPILLKMFGPSMANGMVTFINNIKTMTAAGRQERAERELTLQLDEVAKGAHKELVELKKQQLALSEAMTQEEKNLSNELIREKNELYKQKEALEAKAQAASEYAAKIRQEQNPGKTYKGAQGLSATNPPQAKAALEYVQERGGVISSYQKAFTSTVDKAKTSGNFNKTFNSKAIQEYTGQMKQLHKAKLLDQADNKELGKLLGTLYDKNASVNDKQEAFIKMVDLTRDRVDALGQKNKEHEQTIRGVLDALKENQEKLDQTGQKMNTVFSGAQLKQTFLDITNVVSGVSQLAMGFQSLSQIPKIWNDEDLTKSEKLTQIITSASMALGMLGSGFGTVAKAAGLTTAWEAGVAAANTAIATTGTAATGASLGLAGGLKVAGAAAKGFFTSLGPIGWIIMAAGLLISVLSGIDLITESAEERAEKLEKASKKYEEVSSKLKDLQTELQNATTAMEELTEAQKERDLSSNEKERLRDLRSQTAELRSQEIILKNQARVARKEQTDTYLRSLEKGDYDSYKKQGGYLKVNSNTWKSNLEAEGYSGDTLTQLANVLSNITVADENSYMEAYEALVKAELGGKDPNTASEEDLKSAQDTAESILTEYYMDLEDFNETRNDVLEKHLGKSYEAAIQNIDFLEEDLANATTQMEKDNLQLRISQAQSHIEDYYRYIGSLDDLTVQTFSELVKTEEDFNNLKNTLSKEGGFDSLDEETKKDLQDYAKDLHLPIEVLIEEFTGGEITFQNFVTAAEEANEAIDVMADQLNKLKAALDVKEGIQNLAKSQNKKGYLTADEVVEYVGDDKSKLDHIAEGANGRYYVSQFAVDMYYTKDAAIKTEVADLVDDNNKAVKGFLSIGVDPSDKKKDKDSKDRITDFYHDINTELDKYEKHLSNIEKKTDKLFGEDLLSNLNEQLAVLEAQNDAYERKLQLMKNEAEVLKASLSAQGVTFNGEDITNYAAIKQAKKTSMSEDDYDKFVENLERYETLLYSEIPGVAESIADILDKEIEIKIQKFTYEVELRLEMADFEKEWKDFKKNVIDDIDDDDAIGNLKAGIADLEGFFNTSGTGIGPIQALTEQVNKTKQELDEIIATGTSDVYGNNKAKAMEDLKEYTSQLMDQLGEMDDLVEEIKEMYIEGLEEANELLDKQIERYEYINDLIDHDMNLIKLLYGEDSYEYLDTYYQKIEENNKKQIELQRAKVDELQRQLAEATDEETREQIEKMLQEATSDLYSSLEEAAQLIVDKYTNSIDAIFKELENNVTGGMGFEWMGQEWDLMNKKADMYLDTVNGLYAVQELENKYMDALNDYDSVGAQKKLNSLMNEQLKMLREKDKLTQYDLDRANALFDLELKKIALEEAQRNKSQMRLRRDSNGNYTYQYVADQDKITEAERGVAEAENNVYNIDKDAYKENLDSIYSTYQEYIEAMKAIASDHTLSQEEKEKRMAEVTAYYQEMITDLIGQNEAIRLNLSASTFASLISLHGDEAASFKAMTDAEREAWIGEEGFVPGWNSGIQEMANNFLGSEDGSIKGFVPAVEEAMIKIQEATKEYEDDLDELEKTAKVDFESIKAGEDAVISSAEKLLETNDKLMGQYGLMIDDINAARDALKDLASAYSSVAENAKIAAENSYKAWEVQARIAADSEGKAFNEGLKKQLGDTVASMNTETVTPPTTPVDPPLSNGDGIPEEGEIGEYTGPMMDKSGQRVWSFTNRKVKIVRVASRVTNDPYIKEHPYQIKDMENPDIPKMWVKKETLSKFRTGGLADFTGPAWLDGTKSKPELVLNSRDTQNLLSAVGLIRDMDVMLSALNQSSASRAASLLAMKFYSGGGRGPETIEQNVHIEASFPNVQNSREIEEAFNNLVNIASQRAFNKNF